MGLLFLMDWYVFQGIKSLTANFQSSPLKQGIRWAHWLISLGLPLTIAVMYVKSGRMNPYFMFTGSLFITMLITKAAFVAILMGGDLYRLAEGGINWLADHTVGGEGNFMPGRRKFVSQLALGVAAIPFTSFLYGITKGKYLFKVHRHTLWFDDLPQAFDGFKITQISDVHAGSFDDMDAVRRGVEMINAQQSDLFVFTGDLVNSMASEFDRWVDVFKEIKTPHGQFSILGNHDYGDYHAWPNAEAKMANLEQLKKHHAAAGFRLLLDENVEIEKDGEKISLLGVENWGIGFGQRGNLRKALAGVSPENFKVLLSHDPSHWDNEVKNYDQHVHLTLSGHTHGMQMGVEIPGLRWSPVKYRYPKWAGVYEEAGKYINVNRGFGYLGFAGRVGIWPEITVLELKRKV
jgi:predicted MPP superfamily phosphohydrolase